MRLIKLGVRKYYSHLNIWLLVTPLDKNQADLTGGQEITAQQRVRAKVRKEKKKYLNFIRIIKIK